MGIGGDMVGGCRREVLEGGNHIMGRVVALGTVLACSWCRAGLEPWSLAWEAVLATAELPRP